MDGWVTIGTKLDTIELEKQIKQVERDLDKLQKEEQKLLSKRGSAKGVLQGYLEETKKLQSQYDDLIRKKQMFEKIQENLSLGKTLTPEGYQTYIQLSEQIKNIDNIKQAISDTNDKYNNQKSIIKDINNSIRQNVNKQKELNNSLSELNRKQYLGETLGKIQNKTSSIIKQVAKWALAIFSIRSAYSLVRQASSTLAQYNEQYAKNLEYIRYAIAQAIAPVLEYVVNLAFKLLSYINYIAQAWFGVNLFANASAKSMNKIAGSAKQIRKELAGFDEMNVIGDTSSGSSGGGGVMPGFDLSKMDVPIPKWLEWIGEHKDEILAFFATLGILVGIIKLGEFANDLFDVVQGLEGVNKFIKGNGKKIAGAGVTILGIVQAVSSLIDYLKDPSWENFGGTISGIGLAILGLGIAFGAVPAMIVGAVVAILGIIASYWDKIKAFFDNGFNWIERKIDTLPTPIRNIAKVVFDVFKNIVNSGLNILDGLFVGVRKILDGIIQIFKGDFKGGITNVMKGIVNVLIGIINSFGSMMNTFLTPIRSLIVEAGKILGKNWSLGNVKIPTLKYLKTGGIINMPGRGIPVGGALGGEAGAEGVLPLTDTQAMETLGATIGKYITINATVVNKMNSRVISRELQTINQQQDFAYNM